MRHTTALVTGALAVLVAAKVAVSPPDQHYAIAVAAPAVVGTATAALRLWSVESFCARVASGLLATLIVAVQVLASEIGEPGQPAGQHWAPAGFAVVLLAGLVVVLTASGLVRPRPSEGPEHPYAL